MTDLYSEKTKTLLDQLKSIATTNNDEFQALPPQAYFSPDLLELEKDIISKQGWILIGREDQVANPGD